MEEWGSWHHRQFLYAALSLGGGILVALALIGGFIYLVMEGHPEAAGSLLGAGALSLVSGFLASRLDP
jgi:hypothetical protein